MRKRVCLLTGASGRLGTAFCRAYSSRYDIAAVYHRHPPDYGSPERQPAGSSDRSDCEHGAVFAIKADLAAADSPDYVVDAAVGRFGAIDLLVNGAGFSRWAPIVGSPTVLQSFEAMLTLNAVVPLRLSAAVAGRCWTASREENASANRNVVNVSSTAGLYVYRDLGQSGYAASKAALNMLTCHLAAELESFGVRANTLAPNSFPSYVSTDSVAAAIARLDCSNLNGQILVLDQAGETLLAP